MSLTAHDVRHLRVCPYCYGLCDDRESLPVGISFAHGLCVIKRDGVAGIIRKHTRAILGSLTTGDIGWPNMKTLCAALRRKSGRAKKAGKKRQRSQGDK